MPRSRTCFELWCSYCGHQSQFRNVHMVLTILGVSNNYVALWRPKLFENKVSRKKDLCKVYFIIFWYSSLVRPRYVWFDHQTPHTTKYDGERANFLFFGLKVWWFVNNLWTNFEIWRPCCCCLTCQCEFYQMTSRPRAKLEVS